MTKFKSVPDGFRQELNLDSSKKLILFLGSKKSVRKNIKLVQDAISILNDPDIQLINPYPVAHDEIPKYLNSVNVLATCSYMEGSPNVIKEAMSCNCPIVSSDVGDVMWVMENTEGCYLSSFKAEDYALKLKEALLFSEKHGKTFGENRIKKLGLDSQSTTQRVIDVYKRVLTK